MKNSWHTTTLGAPTKVNINDGREGWNDKLKKDIISLDHLISLKIKAFNGLSTRNGGRGLIKQLLKLVRSLLPRLTKSAVVQVVSFSFFLSRLIKHSGSKGAVIYLKACQVLLQQSVGGNRVPDLSELKVRVKRTKSGLPRVIPSGVRRMIIRDRDIRAIRLWMTLFGFFRIMEFKGNLSFDTITDPGVNLTNFLPKWERFLEKEFKPQLLKKVGGKFPNLPDLSLFPILKSGPTTASAFVNSSMFSLVWSSRIWMRSPLKEGLKVISNHFSAFSFWNKLELTAISGFDVPDGARIKLESLKHLEPSWWKRRDLTKKLNSLKSMFSLYPEGRAFLGKLGFKLEPAGKVRVFAMVDPWTQWLLNPLHQWIFSILKKISAVDGTFNQVKPVERLQSAYAHKCKGRTFSSIDLSAATDRLPISMQESVIRVLLKDIVPDSRLFAEWWRRLLVDRFYQVQLSFELKSKVNLPPIILQGIKYEVGQPMGALSSWAMLALTHHAIVQYAYALSGKTGWFMGYAVLGDDIVFADGRVAYHYKSLLQLIGVKAGLAKSIVARGKFVVEFAKKFFIDQSRGDMVPIKDCIATWTSTALVSEFVSKYQLSLNQILAFLGYGYKSRSRVHSCNVFELGTRLRVILVWLSTPTSSLGRSNWASWLLLRNWKDTWEEVPAEVLYEVLILIKNVCIKRAEFITDYLSKYEVSISDRISNLNKVAPIKVTVPGSSQSMDTNRGLQKSPVDWSIVLSDDFSDDNIIDIDQGDTVVHSRETLLDKRLPKEILLNSDLKDDWLGPPVFDPHFEDARSVIYEPLYSLDEIVQYCDDPIVELKIHIEELMVWLHSSTDIMSEVPKEYWQQSRQDEVDFSNFLEVYSLWQDLSRPIWAHYYKTANEQNRGLHSIDTQSSDPNLEQLALEVKRFSPSIWKENSFFTSWKPKTNPPRRHFPWPWGLVSLFFGLTLSSVALTELAISRAILSNLDSNLDPEIIPLGDRRYMSETYIDDITRDIPISDNIHPFALFAIGVSLGLLFIITRDYLVSGYIEEISAANKVAEMMSRDLSQKNREIDHLTYTIQDIQNSIQESSLDPTSSLTLQEILSISYERIERLKESLDSVMDQKKILLETIENNYLVLDKYREEIKTVANLNEELNEAVNILMLRNSQMESMIERSSHHFSEVQNSVNLLSEFTLSCPNEQLALFALRASQALHNEVVSRHIASNTSPIHWQQVYITSNVRSIISESSSILQAYLPAGVERIGWLDLPNPFMGG